MHVHMRVDASGELRSQSSWDILAIVVVTIFRLSSSKLPEMLRWRWKMGKVTFLRATALKSLNRHDTCDLNKDIIFWDKFVILFSIDE